MIPRALPARLTHAHWADRARRLASLACLLMPLAFLYSRVGGETLIAIVDILFLARSTVRHRWDWLRAPWMMASLAWWAWLVFCSTPLATLHLGEGGRGSLVQALLLIRFLVLAAALSTWLLRAAPLRRAMFGSLAIAAGFIAVQCWQQYIFGTDIFGWPRWSDGALTGPFRQPRAGPALILILFPAILPLTATLLRHQDRSARLTGIAIFALAISTMVLIGQRMPALLTGLGLIACGVALPRLRPLVVGAALTAVILLAASPIVSRPTFQKLVVHFADQMHHFPQSPYGLLYTRAAVMGLDHPGTGLGFDGFRRHCLAPEYQRGLPALGISDRQAAGPIGCSIHPHNHYLEAFTSGGIPGLLLFTLTVCVWLATLGRGLSHGRAEQVGCAIGVLLAVWPFASTSAFFTLPNAGWLFIVLGMGLAEVPLSIRRPLPAAVHDRALALPAGD